MMKLIVADGGYIDFKNNKIDIESKFYILQIMKFLSKNLKSDTTFTNATANEISYIINENFKIQSANLEKDEVINLFNNYITPCKINGF